MAELQFFDPKQEFTIVSKTLPHWAQSGTVVFITWRTADSLPPEVQKRITRERQEILRKFQLDPLGDWKVQLVKLPATVRGRVQCSLFQLSDEQLDAGYGACVLKRPELSKIVEDSLLYGDGDRYFLTD